MNDSDISAPFEPEQALSSPPKRRRRRRWLYIVVLSVLVLALLAYALLPWLIPTNWLRSQIVAGIQDQLGRSASISSIEISWSQGIIVRDIAINRLEQFGPGFLLKASRFQMDFRPLRLLRGQLGRLRLDQPQLWIVTDADGNLNLASLPEIESREDVFEQITITNANLHFIDRVHASETHLAIPQINVTHDTDSGRYSLFVQAAPSKSSGQALFSLQAQFTPTGNGRNPQDILTRGSAKLIWSDFDLAGLLLPRLDKLDLHVLAGKTSGKAGLELYSDGRLELSHCSVELDELHLQVAEIADPSKVAQNLSEPTQIRVPRASFELQGSYELVSGELTIQTLSGTLDGLDYSSSLQGRFFPAERAFAPSAASVTLTVQPSRLREQFPFLDELFREHDLTVTGTSRFTLDFKQSDAIDHLSFSMNASDTGIHLPSLLHKSAGLPCRIKLSAIIDHHTGILALDKPLEIELASGRLSLDMHLAQPLRMASFLDLVVRPREIIQRALGQWSQAQISTSLKIDQISDLRPVFPVLDGLLTNNALTLDGPLLAQLNLQPIPTDAPDSPNQPGHSSTAIGPMVLTATVSLPAQSSLEWPSYFSKPAGEPLSFSFAARLSQGSLRLDDLRLSCKIGQATLSVTDAFCGLEFSPRGWPGFIPSLSTAGEFRVENSAALTKALPALRTLKLAGDLVGRFDLGLEPLVRLVLDLELDATDLHVQVPAVVQDDSEVAVVFRKSALTPAKLDLHFQLDLSTDNNSQAKPWSWLEFTADNAATAVFQAKLNWTLGNSYGSLEIDHRQSPSKQGFGFDVTLSNIDLDSLDENFPLLALACEPYQLAGTAALRFAARLSPELSLESLDFDADLTAAQCIIPAKTGKSENLTPSLIMRKAANLPLTLKARLVTEDDDQQSHRLKIESAQLRFAGSQLNLTGSVLLADSLENDPQPKATSSGHSLIQSLLRLEPFISAQLNADGTVIFNQDLFALFPPLAQLHNRIGLSGVLNYQLEFAAEPGQATLRTKLSSPSEPLKVGPAEFSKAEHYLQLFFKPAPEELTVSAALLEVDLLELNLFDEPLRLSAELSLTQDQLDVGDLFIALGDSSGHFTAHLESITNAPTGSVNFYSPLIDQSRLKDFAQKLSSFVRQQTTPSQSSAADTDDETPSLADNSPGPEQVSALPKLPPMDINLRAELDKLIVSFPDSSVKFTVQQVSLDSQLTSASLTGRFAMAFNGGRLGGDHTILFDEPGLPLSFRYEAMDLIADQSTAPLVSQVFPNLSVKGTITESRTVTAYLRPGKDQPPFQQEKGLNILRDGIVIGPSAPRWVVYWFPKLSITEYPFEVAHNVFSRDPQTGRVTNDMVFIGKGRYNIYITGVTMPDNTTAYKLGVDMSLMSLERRHIWKSWRVPLLSFTGQIVDHKWASQTVSYTWPTRAAWDIFIKNNALKTLIEQWRKAD